jgi:hypothetical protein
VKRRRNRKCAYCGIAADAQFTRDHVVPRCAVPTSCRNANLIVVGACEQCNRSFSDDEVHFRTVIALAGKSNNSVQELWDTKILRSLHQPDGFRRAKEILAATEQMQIEGQNRLVIYPGADGRVMRIIKKIVRGLSHYHEIETAIPEQRISVEICPVEDLFQEICGPGCFSGQYPGVFWYVNKQDHSTMFKNVWILTFFERLTFVALVTDSLAKSA